MLCLLLLTGLAITKNCQVPSDNHINELYGYCMVSVGVILPGLVSENTYLNHPAMKRSCFF
jgi:hypothetical protein